MPLADELAGLASLAGRTLIAAATGDGWEAFKRGFARVLGRGDAIRTRLAEHRLDQTREQLLAAPEPERDEVAAGLEATWLTRLADLLEEDPGLAGELRAVLDKAGTQIRAGSASATGHAVAAGRDVTVTASGGGVAAATIHGNVSPGNPTRPGPAAR
jgi:hypothetical protein